jgi:quercetin dioxygenase-like cupin family protein
MKNITHIKDLDVRETTETAAGKDFKEIFNGDRRRMVEVSLTGGAVLTKHHAAEPITVLCLSGNGTFRAGSDLEESQKLVPGTLITLESGVEHDVSAEPSIRILVTKFKDQ